MTHDQSIRTGPRRFWYARLGLGLLGFVGGAAGIVLGFGTGVLLDHLISRFAFLRTIRRTVFNRTPSAEAELYTVIALYFRELYPDTSTLSGAVEHDLLRQYLERGLQIVFSGDAREFHGTVLEALSTVATGALWEALLEASPRDRQNMHQELLRGQSGGTGEQTHKVWDAQYSLVLGLKEPAGEHDIRMAFRRRALLSHPDIPDGPGTERIPYSFAEIRAAYETLISRFVAEPGGPGSEDDRTDPHSHVQSDTRC
ncbi:MAG: hypothetical protein EA383_00305 [Spirochaetaceae bacterium]|nr:MAG: hypothetical protein EA383_00305 [Spirochaetaceae bacterium]